MASAEMQPIRSIAMLLQQVLDGQKQTREQVDKLATEYRDGHSLVLARIARREVETTLAEGQINKELAVQRTKFDEFKKLRDDNGHLGMCSQHEEDIKGLRITQAKSAGRREVWLMLLAALVLPLLLQLLISNFNRRPSETMATHAPLAHIPAVESYGMVDSH